MKTLNSGHLQDCTKVSAIWWLNQNWKISCDLSFIFAVWLKNKNIDNMDEVDLLLWNILKISVIDAGVYAREAIAV